MKNERITFPEELIENSIFETAIFSAYHEDIGIAEISETINFDHKLRLYQLTFNENTNTYIPVKELVSFSFKEYGELIEFLERLPEMSGIEMLLIINQVFPSIPLSN